MLFGAVSGGALLKGIGGLVAGAGLNAVVGLLGGSRRQSQAPKVTFGQRIEEVHVSGAQEGAPIRRLWGRARLGGQVIWATNFSEYFELVPSFTPAASSGKNFGAPAAAPAQIQFTQVWHAVVSFAVAFCEGGPGVSLGRVWADGKQLDMSKYVWRFYDGSESQEPDPLILAKEGAGNAPAYRGIAYLVFENILADSFGNRIPQITAEIIRRPTNVGPDDLTRSLRSLCMIPGTTEFGYATTVYAASASAGSWSTVNSNADFGRSDFNVSLDSLVGINASVAASSAPFAGLPSGGASVASVTGGNWKSAKGALDMPDAVSLVVSWFGDDLRAGNCTLRPKVETAQKNTTPADWEVAGYTRAGVAWFVMVGAVPVRVPYGTPGAFAAPWGIAAGVVSQIDAALMDPAGAGGSAAFTTASVPAFGGTPSDASVVEAIREIKKRGLRCVFYPFVTMDIPAGNGKPDPYGRAEQPPFPWRGRITCHPAAGQPGTVDKTATAATQVNAFLAQLTTMILHYANLCVSAGGVDAFIIGSEFVGLSQVRSTPGDGVYPFVDGLKSLAASVRAIVGPNCKIGYAADWSEYHSHRPTDGTNDVIFNMDPLWADPNIDFIGIDNYLPLSDWRDLGINIDGRIPPSPLSIGDDFVVLAPDGVTEEAQSTILSSIGAASFTAAGLGAYAAGALDGRMIRFGWQDGPYSAPVENAGTLARIVRFENNGGVATVQIEDPDVSIYDKDYLTKNVEGGEWFDWYYASPADRVAQKRTPIVDTAHGEHWVFRQKDIRSWWMNPHRSRPGGVRNATATTFSPGAKPIWFTEFGCPAVDKGSNQPNVFVDPKSSESFYPHFSNGNRDDAIQRAYLEAMLAYWRDNAPTSGAGVKMLDPRNMFAWAWDARPYPDFPAQGATWRDSPNYHLGHWLTGRLDQAPVKWIVDELCASAGVDCLDASRIVGPPMLTHGVVADGPVSARDLLEQIADPLQIDIYESGACVVVAARSQARTFSVRLDDLVMESPEDVGYSLTRKQETDLPGALALSFVDPYRAYDAGSVRERKSVSASQNVASVNAPLILDPGYAKQLARAMLQQLWQARDTAAIKLPPSWSAVEPGDVVAFDIGEAAPLTFRVERIDKGEFLELELTGFDPSSARFGSSSAGADSLGQSPPQAAGPPIVEFLDLPIVAGDDSAPWAPRVAAFASPWKGVSVYRTVGAANTLIATVATPALMGEIVDGDFYAGPRSVWDYGNSLYVRFYGDAQLFSKSEAEVFEGANAVAVKAPNGQWEIVQFAQAELLDANKYRLSKLLRAQQGTEVGMANPVPIGSRVIVLNPASLATLAISVDQIGQALTLRAGPSTDDPGAGSFFDYSVTPRGVGLRPFSVSQIAGRRLLGYGDVVITWARRTRFGGDAWDPADVPLNEESERYDLEILDWSSNVLRAVAGLTSPAWTYTAAMQAADWGFEPGAIPVRVYQISGQIGRGQPATSTIYL